jgi:hypothetical protein
LSLLKLSIFILQVEHVGVLLHHFGLERLHSDQTLSLQLELTVSFNLRHLLLHLAYLLVFFYLLLGVCDNVGPLYTYKNNRYIIKGFTYSEVLLELGITLLNISQMASKVLLTISESLILLVEVTEVAVAFNYFLRRRSLVVAFHLSECLVTILLFFIGVNLALVLLVLIKSLIIVHLLSDKLLFDPVVPLFNQVKPLTPVLYILSLDLFA